MESLGADLVDQEISVFGMKTVTEEVGNVKAGLLSKVAPLLILNFLTKVWYNKGYEYTG